MPCIVPYISAEDRARLVLAEKERKLQEKRDRSLAKLEKELSQGTARLEQDPITNTMRIVGASMAAKPEGMKDLCVLDALQRRNTTAFRLALGNNLNHDFTKAHVYAHVHGHKH